MSALDGKIIGRKLIESGLMGTIVNDQRLLQRMGPDNAIFLPSDPKGVEIISPSPQTLARCKNYFPSILTYSLSLNTLFLISRCIQISQAKFILCYLSPFQYPSYWRVFIILIFLFLIPLTKLFNTLQRSQQEQLLMMGSSPSDMEIIGMVQVSSVLLQCRDFMIVLFSPIDIMQWM